MFGIRIREQRKKMGLTMKEFGAKFNLAESTISGYENESRKPDIETFIKFASFFDVTLDYLSGGNLPSNITPYNPDDMIKVPVLGSIRAGEPMDRVEYIEGYALVDPTILRGREGFALRVKGDSMIGDRIHEGDIVICVKQDESESSQIAVVAVDAEFATLKRVKCENGMCILSPSNPKYQPFLIPADKTHIIGVVVQVQINF